MNSTITLDTQYFQGLCDLIEDQKGLIESYREAMDTQEKITEAYKDAAKNDEKTIEILDSLVKTLKKTNEIKTEIITCLEEHAGSPILDYVLKKVQSDMEKTHEE